MKYPAFKFAAITSLLLVTGLGGQLLFNSKPPPEEEAEAVLGDARNLEIAYQRWSAQARQNGADRKLVLPLGYSKALSAEFTQAQGQAILDLVDGGFSFEVSGLPDKAAFEVWLVDNRPGPRRSVKPEPGDGLVKLGRLDHGQGKARLETRLDREALRGFKIDLLVVARPDKHPGEGGLLFGSPSLFQRLFYNEKGGLVARLGDTLRRPEDRDPVPAPLRFLVPRAAQADSPLDLDTFAGFVAEGRDLFFNETFEGNGRTCGTCHPKNNNLTIDPPFIATLPATDPLFVAESPAFPDLNCVDGDPPSSGDTVGCRFENPKLMRQFGLIQENVDGIDVVDGIPVNLDKKFVLRGVPHALALTTSLFTAQAGFNPPNQNTGWSGDGAPGSGTLRDFATGAVNQHFTRTLGRQNGIDFVLPTDAQLDDMEAFQLSLGRQADPILANLALTSADATAGKNIFMNGTGNPAAPGTCMTCHFNGGATTSFAQTPQPQNRNFNTGVENLAGKPTTGQPRDGGFNKTDSNGTSATSCATSPAPSTVCGFGNGTFAAPAVIEAADTPPLFHNNALTTIEQAVAFFNGPEFNGVAAAKISMDEGQIANVAKFLRVLNALENIREIDASLELAFQATVSTGANGWKGRIGAAKDEVDDAIKVLADKGLHPFAVQHLKASQTKMKAAQKATTFGQKNSLLADDPGGAIVEERAARNDMCHAGSDAVLCP